MTKCSCCASPHTPRRLHAQECGSAVDVRASCRLEGRACQAMKGGIEACGRELDGCESEAPL